MLYPQFLVLLPMQREHSNKVLLMMSQQAKKLRRNKRRGKMAHHTPVQEIHRKVRVPQSELNP